MACCEIDAPREGILARYARIARERADAPDGGAPYTAAELAALPPGANLGLGTGAPVREARLRAGEVVVDLGSGAGVDVLLAAREVGPHGRAIGVDLTPEMVARARRNAEAHGATNAAFVLAPIEATTLPDAFADVVVSNCVVNLSDDKPRVLAEARRVLRAGGRLVVSDTRRDDATPAAAPTCDCVGGALTADEWRAHLEAAGFADIRVEALPAEGCCETPRVLARAVRP